MPLFNPGPAAAGGLDLLVQAATDKDAQSKSPSTRAPALVQPGPFNPAASLSTKVVKRILDLEFVDMSEVSVDADLPQGPDRPPAPARLPVTDISQWLERFSLMAAILTTRFPDKAPELFAYQAMIVRAERNYEGKRWVSYDRQFRREALARKDLNWSVTDPRLYNEPSLAEPAVLLGASTACRTTTRQRIAPGTPTVHSSAGSRTVVIGGLPPEGPNLALRLTLTDPPRRFAGVSMMGAASRHGANIVMPVTSARVPTLGWTAPGTSPGYMAGAAPRLVPLTPPLHWARKVHATDWGPPPLCGFRSHN